MTMYKSQKLWHEQNKKRKQENWLRWSREHKERRAEITKKSYLKRKALAETQR